MSHGLSDDDSVVGSHGSSGGVLMSLGENLVYTVQDSLGSGNEFSVGPEDKVSVTVHKSGSLHDMEHFVDHGMMVNSGVVDNSVELMDELVMVNKLVHISLTEVDMTF